MSKKPSSYAPYYTFLLKVIISLFISFPILAQSDFRKGFIVSLEGDTIDGWVDYRGNLRNSNTCSFKKKRQSLKEDFDYNQIKGFGFTNTRYLISSELLPKNEFYNGFVEILILGNTSLFFGRSHYYILSRDKKVIQLSNPTKKIIASTGDNTRITSDLYKQQLEAIFSDCSNLSSKDFKNTPLDHRSLMKLVRIYNECSGQESKIINKELRRLELWIGTGGEFQDRNLKFNSNSKLYQGLTKSDISSSQLLNPKIFLLTQLPFVNKRLTVGLEFSYFKEYYSANYEDLISPVIGKRYSTYIHYSNFKTILVARYIIPMNRVSVFSEFGFFNRYLQKPTSLGLIEEQYLSTITIVTENSLAFKNNEFGLVSGLGMYLNFNSEKKIFVTGRFEIGNGLIERSLSMNSISKTICVNAGLLLPILRNRER